MRKNSSKPGLVGPIGVTSAAIDLTRIDPNKNVKYTDIVCKHMLIYFINSGVWFRQEFAEKHNSNQWYIYKWKYNPYVNSCIQYNTLTCSGCHCTKWSLTRNHCQFLPIAFNQKGAFWWSCLAYGVSFTQWFTAVQWP